MGNEASQEGGENAQPGAGGTAVQSQARMQPPLLTQQSMPLPTESSATSSGVRRGSIQLLRRASSAGATAAAAAAAAATTSAPAQPQPQPPPPQQPQPSSKRGSIVEMPPELDLSNLSEEERATILSVMARAQSMEEATVPPERKDENEETMRRGSVSSTQPPQQQQQQPQQQQQQQHPQQASESRKPEPSPQPAVTCPKCHSTELTAEVTCQCVECGANVCRKCSTAIPSGKKHVWMCVTCAENYPQLIPVASKAPVGDKGEPPPKQAREEQHGNRRQTHGPQVAPANAIRPPPGVEPQQPASPRPRSGSLPGPHQKPQDFPQPQQQRRPSQQGPLQPRPHHPAGAHQQGAPHPQQDGCPRPPFPQQPQQKQQQQHPQQMHPAPAPQQAPHHPSPQNQFPQHGPPPPHYPQQQQQPPQHPLPQQRPHGPHPQQLGPQQAPQHHQQQPQQPPHHLMQQQQQQQPQHQQQVPHHPQPAQKVPIPNQQIPQQQPPPHQNLQKIPPQPQQQQPAQANSAHHQQYTQQAPPQYHPQQTQPHPQQHPRQNPPYPQQDAAPQKQSQEKPAVKQPQQQQLQAMPQQQPVRQQQPQQKQQQGYQQISQERPQDERNQHLPEDQHQKTRAQNQHPFEDALGENSQVSQRRPPQQGPQPKNQIPQAAQREKVQGGNACARQPELAQTHDAHVFQNGPDIEAYPQNRVTSTLPRTGKNPFRSDTNPFRTTSSHEEVAAMDMLPFVPGQDGKPGNKGFGKDIYRGGISDTKDQDAKYGALDQSKVPAKPEKQEQGESVDQRGPINRPRPEYQEERRGSWGEAQKKEEMKDSEQRHKEEEQRRNAANSSQPPEPVPRRQLPSIDKTRQKKQLPELPQNQRQNFNQPQQQQQQQQQQLLQQVHEKAGEYPTPVTSSPPVPRARTSVQDKLADGRNGQPSIPRTVPLTSVTLQQQLPQQHYELNAPHAHAGKDQKPQHSLPPAGHVKQTQQLLQQQIVEQQQQQKQRFHDQQPGQRERSPQLSRHGIQAGELQLGKQQAEDANQIKTEEVAKAENSEKSKQAVEEEIYRSFGVIFNQNHLQEDAKRSAGQQQQQQKVEPGRKEGDRTEKPKEAGPKTVCPNTKQTAKTIEESQERTMADIEREIEKYQEEDEDDYFKLIENAICVRKPQVVLGVKRSSDIQKQLLNKEAAKEQPKKSQESYVQRKGHVVSTVKQLDMFNQNYSGGALGSTSNKQQPQPEGKLRETRTEDGSLYKQEQRSRTTQGLYHSIDDYDDGYVQLKRGAKYIIPPASTDIYSQRTSYDPRNLPEETRSRYGDSKSDMPPTATTYDKLLLHQLAPDSRQPSAKHYLEEHKTQPLSYEAFSSAKALQQTQRRSSEPLLGSNQKTYPQQEGMLDREAKRSSYSYGMTSDSALTPRTVNQYANQEGNAYQVPSEPADLDERHASASDPSSAKPNAIDLQNQKKSKPKPDPQDWSPVSDLSPIMDVSPSVEAAEQELMKKFQEKTVNEEYYDDDLDEEEKKILKSTFQVGGIPRATSGTISGMLEEFNRALGLPGTSPVDDSGIKTAVSPTSLAVSPISAGSSIVSSSPLHKEFQENFPRTAVDPAQRPQTSQPQPQPQQTGSPQKTAGASKDAQPTTPRRTHRRLPQPTVEQMQAAVAMAAQGPRDRAAAAAQQHIASSSVLITDVTTSAASTADPSTAPASTMTSSLTATGHPGRPVSPMVPWKGSEVNNAFDQAYRAQQGGHLRPSGSADDQPPKPQARTPHGIATACQGVTKPTDTVTASAQHLPTSAATSQPTNSEANSPGLQARRLRSASCSSVDPRTGSKAMEDAALRSVLNGSCSPSLYMTMTSSSEKVATTEGSPQTPSTPRDKGGDSSDTQSEAESVKSVRLRRKLPSLPQDQRSSPSPTRRNLDKNKTPPSSTEFQETPSATKDGNANQPGSSESSSVEVVKDASPSSFKGVLGLHSAEASTPSAAEARHHKMSPSRAIPGLDGSALTPESTSSQAGRALSPARDASTGIQIPTGTPHSRTPSPSLSVQDGTRTEVVSPSGTMLPQYMQSLKQQLRDELKAVTEERKVMMELRKDRETSGQVNHMTTLHSANRQQLQKRLTEDDITIMTTATSTVVSSTASQPLSERKLGLPPHRKDASLAGSLAGTPAHTPVMTMSSSGATMLLSGSNSSSALAPTAMALRRQQQLARMQPQASPKKSRRRHTSEITVPPFAGDEYQRTPFMGIQAVPHPAHMYSHAYHQQRAAAFEMQPQSQQVPSSYKSMEFEALDGHVRPAPGTMMGLRPSSRYGGSLGSGLSMTDAYYEDRTATMQQGPYYGYLTDNRITGPDAYFQSLNNEINRLRRSTEAIPQDPMYGGGTAWGDSFLGGADVRASPQTAERRKKKEKKIRKPRSWQPSPYVSEDEDDQMTREEKKAKIKAEIARRRQQIEENMRLHEELVKLARKRDRQDGVPPGVTNQMTYKSPSSGMMYSPSQRSIMEMSTPIRSASSSMGLSSTDTANTEDTSSVLKAIDEILRKDLYSGPQPRGGGGGWCSYSQTMDPRMKAYGSTAPTADINATQLTSYYTVPPRSRYEYTGPRESQDGTNWYSSERTSTSPNSTSYFPEPSAEDESIERIASTFPTDEPPDILLSATPGPPASASQTFQTDLSPVTPSDTETPPDHDATPAMPLLPDMPTRSRKLLENLGSSPIQPSRSGSVQSIYQDGEETTEVVEDPGRIPADSQTSLVRSSRKSSRTISKTVQKYDFPVKRILLTRDPKDRSVSGNGLGMKVIGGKEVPGSNGMIGAYVAKIFPGGVVETLGEVKEGDQVLEWNGISLTGRTYEEVQRIIASSADEVEIVIRCDLNMLESLSQHQKSPALGISCSRSGFDPNDMHGGNPSPGAQSPYSPAGSSSRVQSPALNNKRMIGGGGGNSGNGGNSDRSGMMNNNNNNNSNQQGMVHSALSGSGHNSTSSFGNANSPEKTDGRLTTDYSLNRAVETTTTTLPKMENINSKDVVPLFPLSSRSRYHSFSSASANWPDVYDAPYYCSPIQEPSDEYVQLRDDSRQSYWRSEADMDELQFQVACSPRAAIMYVPIIPMRPFVSLKNNGYVSQPLVDRASLSRRSLDHLPDYESLVKGSSPLWKTSFTPEVVPLDGVSQRSLGMGVLNYDLLQSKAKVSLHLNGLRDKKLSDFPSLYAIHTKNGVRKVQQVLEDLEDPRSGTETSALVANSERPKAPQDLPGLRPVFVNDWKKTKKEKEEQSDDNNNNKSSSNNNNKEQSANGSSKKNKSHVGSSPDVSPYSFLPKGCRGSFCALL